MGGDGPWAWGVGEGAGGLGLGRRGGSLHARTALRLECLAYLSEFAQFGLGGLGDGLDRQLGLPRGDGSEEDHPEGKHSLRARSRRPPHLRRARRVTHHVLREQTAEPRLGFADLLEQRRVEGLCRAHGALARGVKGRAERLVARVLRQQLVRRQVVQEAVVDQVAVGLHECGHLFVAVADGE